MNKTSIKFSDNCLSFLNKARLNRIKIGESELKSYDETLELIANYFKLNNYEYSEMLKMENNK